MFYGILYNKEHIVSDSFSIKALGEKLSWQGSEHHFFSISKFAGGLILHNSMPYGLSDFYYFNDNDNIQVIISGNIYNKNELVVSIDSNKSEISCPELIAELYKKQGISFIKNLNGDFAVFIYDISNNLAFLIRDHMGIRPLSYSLKDNTLWFSSDTINLCKYLYPEEEINTEYLLQDFKFTDRTLTPNSKVYRLLPGHYLEHSNEVWIQKKYWYPEETETDKSLTYNNLISDMKLIVSDAVNIRCDTRFNAAVHVSGGLDSSAVALHIRKIYCKKEPFYGFSWSPDYEIVPKEHEGISFDERILVKKLCEKLKIKPIFNTITESDYLKYFSNPLVYSNYFHEQKILEKSTDLGINLIFSGYGGDEFISVDTLGNNADLITGFNWKIYLRKHKGLSFKRFIKEFLYRFLLPYFGLIPPSIRKDQKNSVKYLLRSYKKNHKDSIKKFFFYRSRRQSHMGDLYHYHIPQRTEEWYLKGIRSGIEYRYPLMDKRIIEYLFKVPSKLLYKNEFSRVILRELCNGVLPDDIFWSQNKIDYSLRVYIKKIAGLCSAKFYNEIINFKSNPELYFVDFKKLEKDITKLNIMKKEKQRQKLKEIIDQTLFDLKWIHEFTRRYRE